MGLRSHRIKRGLQKLIPKWKNPSAGQAFYMFNVGAVFMFCSFAAPFWSIEDITTPCMPDATPPPPCNPWKLNIVGGLDCEAYTLDDTKLWPDDLCGEDWTNAELCPAISDDGKKVKDKILECKYYQHGFAGMIAGCTFLAMGGGIICGVYALKAATKPSASDLKLTKAFGGFGFLAFLLGLVAVALFTPGTRGEKGNPAAGFMVQVIGLCCQLGGVITIVDAGQADIVMPALNFANFSAQQNTGGKTKVAPAAPAAPKQKV